MLYYLLYIINQKGIPAMGLPGCIARRREAEVGGGMMLRMRGDYAGLCYRESFVLYDVLLLLCFLWSPLIWVWWPPGKKNKPTDPTPCGEFHHDDGAPTLLFLMVVSEHSASDESQSESPNWSGFWRQNERKNLNKDLAALKITLHLSGSSLSL